ncbi:DUF4365 domain-containing protein [Comamonas thiooxydans]|uniref:DUF4365 domain-containing protein n=1 Tax=Comamonas thiooxydans TaxID=363952 RepID=UPI0005F7F442|nr:DUF4365 domain-containing protein [Comamonas thiooxydans]OAD83982.1 hypothetical protein ATN89_12205 [Comamonas thiooxydans]CUB01436.1 Domain of unknown function (DUF4365) [Comamonas thiooxydans]
MDPNKQKEEFQHAYLCALAAQAGLNRGEFRVDDDSVDVTFQTKGYVGTLVRNPAIQLQMKCTSQNLINKGVIKFPLSRKNYDDLRGKNVAVPRYLAVLIVPNVTDQWISHRKKHMALNNCCYWVSLRDAPATENSSTITVDVPLRQKLTTDVLRQMMDAASRLEGL